MPPWVEPAWAYITAFLNSSVVTAFIGSVAGALGGAWAARRIAERAKQRDDITREINNTNAAMSSAIGIMNMFLGIKRQHVKRLYDEFNETKARIQEAIRDNAGRHPPAVITFDADLETLPPIHPPVDQLQTALFEKLSLQPGALMLFPVLLNAIRSFNAAVEARNSLIEKWKGRPLDLPLYFGFPANGHVDQTYPSLVDAIYTYTDDVIAFSKMIAELLAAHGDRQKKKFGKLFRGSAPSVAKFDLKRGEDLVPPKDNYADWQWVFSEKAPPALWYVRLYEKFTSSANEKKRESDEGDSKSK